MTRRTARGLRFRLLSVATCLCLHLGSGQANTTTSTLNCRNPLFRVHWPNSTDHTSSPKALNQEAEAFPNLTVCQAWRGRDQCCNPELEPVQIIAFERWKADFAGRLAAMRAYVAHMTVRAMTPLYKAEPAGPKAEFDQALRNLNQAVYVYPTCMLALLRYVAGMICFMCDPEWNEAVYSDARTSGVTSMAVSEATCSGLWKGCQRFAGHARAAWRAILQCPLAKQISAPLPNIDVYFTKSALCNWARDRIASHPMRESTRAMPKPTTPAWPKDFFTTSLPSQGMTTLSPHLDEGLGSHQGQESTVSNSNVSDSFSGSSAYFPESELGLSSGARLLKSSASPVAGPSVGHRRLATEESDELGGRTYITAAFHAGDLRAGALEEHGELKLSQHLGGAEDLGLVSQVAVDYEDGLKFFYLAVGKSQGSDKIIQYRCDILSGRTVLSEPNQIWPAEGNDLGKVVQLQMHSAELYVATSKGAIFRLGREALDAGTRLDGTALYSPDILGEKQEHVTGLVVRDDLFWCTTSQIYTAPLDGAAAGKRRTIWSAEDLFVTAGSQATIQDIAVGPGAKQVYVAVRQGGVEQVSTVYRFQPDSHAGVPLKLAWDSIEDRLQLLLHRYTLYISSGRGIFEAPALFATSDSAVQLYSLPALSPDGITDFALYFVRGTDCVFEDWHPVGKCSVTCGGGRLRQERQVRTPASDGGRECTGDLVWHSACNTQACPHGEADCKMGQWINQEPCSKSCGDGEQKQSRRVVRAAGGKGMECPAARSRVVPCHLEPCGGRQYLLAGTRNGMYSARLEEPGQKLSLLPVAADRQQAPELLAADIINGYIYIGHHNAVLQWRFGVGDDDYLSTFSEQTIWQLDSAEKVPIAQAIALSDDKLFIAFDNGDIQATTLEGRSQDDPLESCYPHAGALRGLSLVGTYLVWGTPKQIILGSTNCSDPLTPPEPILSVGDLHATDNTSKEIEIANARLSLDAKQLLMLLWDPTLTTLRMCAVDFPTRVGTRPTPRWLSQVWTHRDYSLAVTPQSVFIFDSQEMWSADVAFTTSSAAYRVYSPMVTSEPRVATYLFAKGVDCVVSDWTNASRCSRTCGKGTLRQTRGVRQPASQGGVPCPSDLERTVWCNEAPCLEDCQVSGWVRVGHCSLSCGGGLAREARKVLQNPDPGGAACPEDSELERKVACNTHPCGGIDCRFSPWVNDGECSKMCGSGVRIQRRSVQHREEYGGRPCSDFDTERRVICNPTPCAQRGYDSLEAGKQTGFDFNVAVYCDHPEQCKTLEDVEALVDRPAPTSAASAPGGALVVSLGVLLLQPPRSVA